MDKHERTTQRRKPEQARIAEALPEHKAALEREEKGRQHAGAATGAALGTVAIGPLGAPIGAAAGAVADALAPDPNEPPSHTHDLDIPCYDGCPAWKSER